MFIVVNKVRYPTKYLPNWKDITRLMRLLSIPKLFFFRDMLFFNLIKYFLITLSMYICLRVRQNNVP